MASPGSVETSQEPEARVFGFSPRMATMKTCDDAEASRISLEKLLPILPVAVAEETIEIHLHGWGLKGVDLIPDSARRVC